MTSLGRMWWLLRRDMKRGVKATLHARRTLPRICDWRCPEFEGKPSPVLVHVLVGEEQALMAAWMLASWFMATGRNWNVILHDDGTLTAETMDAFAVIFPHRFQILQRADADEAMNDVLVQHLGCQAYRQKHPLAQKIFDIPALTPADRFIILDSDLAFFRRPDAILDWVDSGRDECWFNQDVEEACLLTGGEAREILHINLWPRVNSGLCLLTRRALSLDYCERCFRGTGLADGHFWRIEQTLFALCASRFNQGGLLGPEYEVSLGREASPGVVCRHYVGAVRDAYYREALPRLLPLLQLDTGHSE